MKKMKNLLVGLMTLMFTVVGLNGFGTVVPVSVVFTNGTTSVIPEYLHDSVDLTVTSIPAMAGVSVKSFGNTLTYGTTVSSGTLNMSHIITSNSEESWILQNHNICFDFQTPNNLLRGFKAR